MREVTRPPSVESVGEEEEGGEECEKRDEGDEQERKKRMTGKIRGERERVDGNGHETQQDERK